MNKQVSTSVINKIGRLAPIIALSVMLCGCGSEKSGETRITIDKDGAVTSTIYDDFGEEYYDLSELEDMATREISYYNSEYDSPKITLSDSKTIGDGEVMLSMQFESADDYSHFNQVTFFYGTVAEAQERGFSISGDLLDSNGIKISKEALADYSERHIIISSDKTKIVAPFNIEYATRNVVIKDKKEADLSEVFDDNVQLLLSK